MQIDISETKDEMGRKAAEAGAEQIRAALAERGESTIVIPTGASQFEMIAALTAAEGIDWSRVTGFHLDEYADLPISHPASFRRYLKERFVEKLPVPIKAFHYVEAEGDLAAECVRLGALIRQHTVDVAFVGIGENGHLAFNDPPADFTVDDPYIAVELDEACRRQQMGEGWFPTLDDVPRRAISMSIRQILRSRTLICTVPDERKAKATAAALEGPVTPDVPASILQTHERVQYFLDRAGASQLSTAN